MVLTTCIIIHSAIDCRGLLGEYLLNKRMCFLIISCSMWSSYCCLFFSLFFFWKVNYTERRNKETHLLLPLCGPSLLPVCVNTDDRRKLPYFSPGFSGHGGMDGMDTLNTAEYTVIPLSRQLPDWEQLSGKSPSMCLHFHRVLEWWELLMSNQMPWLVSTKQLKCTGSLRDMTSLKVFSSWSGLLCSLEVLNAHGSLHRKP